MSVMKHLYDQLATAHRNLVTTSRGWQLRRLRYTRHTWNEFERLMESQFWSAPKFEDYQLDRLRFLVNHASRNSPYYESRYKRLGVGSNDILSLGDIRKLPIIAKEEFRQNADGFVITSVDRKHMLRLSTSGTTGTPLSAYHLHHNMQERIAMMERLYHWYTPYKWRKRASFTGRLIVHPDHQHPPFHRVNPAIRQQLYSSHHLTSRSLDHYVNELAAFSPEQIDGIASPIFVIADHLVRTGQAGAIKPRVLIPTSETLWPSIRSRMELGFQCKAANQYGSQEGAPIAYECPEGGFHICPESGIFEVLRPDGTPCEAGELGRLVVTSFLSEGTPLIRYDIGDLAVPRAGPCPCGRRMPMLAEIVGRVDQMFFTHERGIVPRVDSAFKSMPGSIIATQVAQLAIDRFEVRIIPDIRLYRPEHGASLIEHLHEYLGTSVQIDLTLVHRIPRTVGGKMPVMVNECRDPQVKNAITDHWNNANVSRS